MNPMASIHRYSHRAPRQEGQSKCAGRDRRAEELGRGIDPSEGPRKDAELDEDKCDQRDLKRVQSLSDPKDFGRWG